MIYVNKASISNGGKYMYDDYDVCYECKGYGDDYFINDDGELECYCSQCYLSRDYDNYDDWDD